MAAQQLEEELQQTRGVDEVLVPQQDQSFAERLQEGNTQSAPTGDCSLAFHLRPLLTMRRSASSTVWW